MKTDIRAKLSANSILGLLLFCWWALNVIQSAFTGLADDEAYYWYYASHLDWGYFDHPPVTALLVAMGSVFGGSLGIRFFFTLLLPLSCYIFWILIRPQAPTCRDALLYFIICFSLPVAQLYGFIATPDAPLMFSVAVFLWAYSRFSGRDTMVNTAILGFAMALMAYSKYHGALVVIFTVLSNPKLLKNPKLYLSGVITLALFTPHLLWQYQHDWVSFIYHLVGRNGFFELNNITDFLLNVLLIFNPFFLWFYYKGWGRGDYAEKTLRRALYFNVAGFLLFFLFSSIRGYVQPQWVLPITYGLIMIAFGWSRERLKAERYVFRTGIGMAVLFLMVRLVAIFNPFGIKFEIFHNEENYEAISSLAGGRPVLFSTSYAKAAKYMYYTGEKTYSLANTNYRESQWQFSSIDRDFTGEDVVVQLSDEFIDSTSQILVLPDGSVFNYKLLNDFHPVREVSVDFRGDMPQSVRPGDAVSGVLDISNPYPYDIIIDGNAVKLEMMWGRNKEIYSEYNICRDTVLIPAFGNVSCTFEFAVPDRMKVAPRYGNPNGPITYQVGFVLRYGPTPPWIQSRKYQVDIDRSAQRRENGKVYVDKTDMMRTCAHIRHPLTAPPRTSSR